MREIKHRGIKRNPYGDRWVYGYYALLDGEHTIITPHSSNLINAMETGKPIPIKSIKHTVDSETIGQYTRT